MGQDILHGEELQLTVPRGTWQEPGWSLAANGRCWALLWLLEWNFTTMRMEIRSF